jgi:mannose-6-phosphate isomerase-like protein (cupin superfamily)
MDIFDVHRLLAQRDKTVHTYEEFFRAETLSVGLSVWPAGSVDEQKPHAEDEVYYVAEGRGKIQVGEEDQTVGPGSVVFVAAGVDHHFHDIEDSLHVVVFWAPPHHSREGTA